MHSACWDVQVKYMTKKHMSQTPSVRQSSHHPASQTCSCTVLLAVLLGCFGHSLVLVASVSAQHEMLLLLQNLTAQQSQTDVWATLCATCIWRAFALAMSLQHAWHGQEWNLSAVAAGMHGMSVSLPCWVMRKLSGHERALRQQAGLCSNLVCLHMLSMSYSCTKECYLKTLGNI